MRLELPPTRPPVPASVPQRLAQLRRRLRTTTLLFGVGLLVAVVGGGAFVAGLLDWLVHLDDAGVRCLIGVTLLLAGAGVVGWWIVRPLWREPSDTRLALAVEKRFPSLRDRFASTVAFEDRACDPALGSPALQRRTIAETERRIARLNVAAVVPTKPARIAAGFAVGVCATIAVVAGFHPTETGTALERLLFPFGARDWPRTTRLQYVDERLGPVPVDPDHPLRRARGDTLELYVVNDLGDLPETVELETRIGDRGADDVERESKPLRRIVLRDADGRPREVFKLVLPVERGPLAFRVVGGDDRDRPFQPVTVVPPPTLASLQVEVHPPTYTGEPSRTLPAGVGHVAAIVGTRIDVRATTSKPVRLARLHVKDRRLPIDLDPGETSFRTSFVVTDAGIHSYWFQLVDAEDVENARATRYEIRGRDDAVPTVTIEQPAVDGRVTARARVPLRIVAKDDLAVGRVERVIGVETTGDPRPTPVRDLLWAGEPNTLVEVERVWNLADIGLRPGDRVTLVAEAVDAYEPADLEDDEADEPSAANTVNGHVGKSLVRTLLVVTDDDKRREIAAGEGTLVDDLDRVAEAWRSARDRTDELLVQRNTVGRLRDTDVDVLKGVELDQRRATERMLDPVDGVLPRAEGLLREFANNDLDDPEVRRNVEAIVDELRFLKEGDLAAAVSNLTAARKRAAEGEESETDPADDPLAAAREGQGRVVDTLDDLLARLSKSRSRRELEDDLDALVDGQRELRDRTAAMLNRTIGRDADDLSEQDRAELGKIAGRQRTRAEEVERLRRRLEASEDALRRESPDAADVVGDAERTLAERNATAAMESAADLVERNDVGRAMAAQERALDALEEARSALRNRSVTDAETLVKELKDVEDELELLKQEQVETLEKIREAADDPDAADELEKLEKRQQELRRRAERASRRLNRLQARSAGDASRRAAERMDDVERLLKEDREPRDELEREVLDELDQALRDTADARREAEERLARELLESVGDELRGIVKRQSAIVTETERLRDEVAERGSLKRSQIATIRNLAETQRTLRAEVDGIAERLAAAEVFVLALEGAAADMERAAERLADRRPDDRTIAVEREAVARIESLVAALEDDGDADTAPPDGGGGTGENPPEGNPDPDVVPLLAQLRLLKAMQERLLERTARLDETRAKDELPEADVRAELESLATEQERIADLARSLVERLAGPMEGADDQ